ncbi:hypothetical protein M514_12197 [Trichuris suis]|uniref:Uncharacterized protein n=1 Tax=Trichuris suis TaxID=68888 RepID=A0A085LPL1_9BILA|nr:hypothetical protein M513_12197 [Trichuris suis]KFD64260.1 hypothetical protein M514_12197 [Trichuris suis]
MDTVSGSSGQFSTINYKCGESSFGKKVGFTEVDEHGEKLSASHGKEATQRQKSSYNCKKKERKLKLGRRANG